MADINKNSNSGRSAIWGGATAGLALGLVLGFFVESIGLGTGAVKGLLYGVLIGVGTEILRFIGDSLRSENSL